MLIAPPEALVTLFKPWNSFYNDSKLTETITMFLHTAALVVAGGIAIATDRATLRGRAWSDEALRHHLDEIAVLHRTVVAGLTITVLSGLALFTSDVETFWGSWIFWVKMTMVAVLLANGARMLGIESGLRATPASGAAGWARLRRASALSISLWLLTTLAGIALLNYA